VDQDQIAQFGLGQQRGPYLPAVAHRIDNRPVPFQLNYPRRYC
jgi:hypothetical protein